MEKDTKENISKALVTIQNLCIYYKGRGECERCPLFDEQYSTCNIVSSTTPSEWNINEKKETVWRALL